ncbi:MAG: lipopolysaccharide heptosyltransferase II [Nitrospirae bacterium]|nr:lipopolysaccharide heptosyltransferase II [Nitrospirota bacterium]
MEEGIKKILVRGVNWIGDAVLTTPAINALRKAYPGSSISILVKPWVSGIFEGSPDIDEIIIYEEKFNGIKGKLELARLLRTKKFDMAILLQNAFDAALIAWLSGIPERIGYDRDYRSLFLTKAVPVKTVQSSKFKVQSSENKNIPKQHQVYYYLTLLKEALNIESDDIEPAIYLRKDEIHEARNILNSSVSLREAERAELRTPQPRSAKRGGPNSELIIGINPGAAYGSAKRWQPRKFAEVIYRIINELNGSVVLFGSSPEIEIANEISSQLTDNSSRFTVHGLRLLNLAGRTTLRQLASLISECNALITNDSGPMHIASSVSVPIVALFGSTNPEATGPLGKRHEIIYKRLSCSPCMKRECPEEHLRCMEEITVDDVFNALKAVLPEKKAVFLDRDGTIIEDAVYLNTFEKLKILPYVPEGIQRLKSAGFKLIGITNQSGIARGIVDEGFVKESNAYLQKTLGIDAFYYCPHHPDDNCLCRKPETLLLRKARAEHGINLRTSYVIGDKISDVWLAKNSGAKGILFTTGQDKEPPDADFTSGDFMAIVEWILGNETLLSS